MCTGVEAAPIIIAALGTGASYMAAEQADKERKQALIQGIEQDEKIQDKANLATQDYVQETFDPTKRQENYETAAGDTERALGQLLSKQSDLGQGDVSAATSGAVSADYTRAKAKSAADAATKARSTAKLLSRGGALGNLFGNEAMTGADYASDMLGFGADSRMNSSLTNARYGQAGGAGRDLALLGGLLSGASTAYGGQQKPAGG